MGRGERLDAGQQRREAVLLVHNVRAGHEIRLAPQRRCVRAPLEVKDLPISHRLGPVKSSTQPAQNAEESPGEPGSFEA